MNIRTILKKLMQLTVMGLSLGIIVLFPFIHLIPYLNIYAREVLFILACVDMLLCFALFQVTFKHVINTLSLLLAIMYILHITHRLEEAEYIGNMIYLLLCVGCVKEFIKPTVV